MQGDVASYSFLGTGLGWAVHQRSEIVSRAWAPLTLCSRIKVREDEPRAGSWEAPQLVPLTSLVPRCGTERGRDCGNAAPE